MSSYEVSDDKQRFLEAAVLGRLKEGIDLSKEFCNDENVLSRALILSCKWEGHLEVAKWLVEHTAADVNWSLSESTPLTAACWNDHLDIVKYLVETRRVDVNLRDNGNNTPLTRAYSYVSSQVLFK